MGFSLSSITLTGYFVYGLTLILFSSATNKILAFYLNIEVNLLIDLAIFLSVGIILFLIVKNIPAFQKTH